jgi:hypothetical protein
LKQCGWTQIAAINDEDGAPRNPGVGKAWGISLAALTIPVKEGFGAASALSVSAKPSKKLPMIVVIRTVPAFLKILNPTRSRAQPEPELDAGKLE